MFHLAIEPLFTVEAQLNETPPFGNSILSSFIYPVFRYQLNICSVPVTVLNAGHVVCTKRKALLAGRQADKLINKEILIGLIGGGKSDKSISEPENIRLQ